MSSPSGTGITHKDNNVVIMDHTTNNLNVGLGSGGAYTSIGNDFGIVLERENVSISSGDHISDVDVDSNDFLNDNDGPSVSPAGRDATIEGGVAQTASTSMLVNSYLMMLVADSDKNHVGGAGEVVFDGEIVGILMDQPHTRHQTVDGNTFHNTNFIYNFTDSGGNSNATDTDPARTFEGKSSSHSSSYQNFFNTTVTSNPPIDV